MRVIFGTVPEAQAKSTVQPRPMQPASTGITGHLSTALRPRRVTAKAAAAEKMKADKCQSVAIKPKVVRPTDHQGR